MQKQWSLSSDFSNSAVNAEEIEERSHCSDALPAFAGVNPCTIHTRHNKLATKSWAWKRKRGNEEPTKECEKVEMGKHIWKGNMGVGAVLDCRFVRVESWRSIAS